MMKIIFLTMGLLLSCMIAAQNPIFTTAKIDEVTLYLNAAEMSHTATVALKKGTNEIVVKNISNRLDNNSIRVGANKNVTILSATFSNRYFTEFEVDQNSLAAKKVRDSIKLVNQQLLVLKNKTATETQAISILDKNQVVGSDKGVSVTELQNIVEYYRKKRLELSNAIDQLKAEEKELRATLARLQNQLTVSEKEIEKTSDGKIVLQVMSETAQSVSFSLSYNTNLASWVPFYEINSKGVEKPLEITSKGNVFQSTGIDWKQVQLTFSSTQPNADNRVPEYSPWYLALYDPQAIAIRGYMKKESARNSRMMEYQEAVQSEDIAYYEKSSKADISTSAAAYTQVAVQTLSLTYKVAIPYDVYSNGKPHAVTLNMQEVPVDYDHYVAPRLSTDAYLVASITDYSQYNLLEGEANIIFEGMYIGKTYIEPLRTEDTLKIGLGIDKNVIVEREKAKEKSGNKFVSSYKESSFTYDIIVRNNKPTPIKITISEQIPLSVNKEVTVSITQSDGAKIDEDFGLLMWELNLKPEETKKKRFGYKVKFPKNRLISNL